MALKVFADGDVLTGADVNEYLVNTLFVKKTATESVTSSTTLQNDDALVLAVEANVTYEFSAVILYDGSTAGDFKYAFTLPAGAGLFASAIRLPTGGADSTAYILSITEASTNAGALGAAFTVPVLIRGLLVMSATAGNIQFQWAQNTSDGTATRVFANSYLCLHRVS